MKWLIRIIAAVLILLVVGVFALYLSLDHIIKSVVESQGTEQLAVPTTLGGANLGLINGNLNLDTLAIGSPPGFSAPQMFSVGKLAVETGGVMRLRNEPIHLSSITIDQPELVIEQNGTRLNYRELMDHLPKHTDQGTQSTSSTSTPVKLVIDTLTITNAHVLLKSNIPGLGKEVNVAIPTIDMKNIGNADGANNGEAIKDVATTVITKMVEGATHSSDLPVDVKALLSGNLNGAATDAVQKELDKAKIPVNVNGLLNQLSGNKPQQ